jgi:hypothetical protein
MSEPETPPVAPFSAHVALEDGGDAYLTSFPDGTYRLAIEKNGVRASFPVTLRDMKGLRRASGDVILNQYSAWARP